VKATVELIDSDNGRCEVRVELTGYHNQLNDKVAPPSLVVLGAVLETIFFENPEGLAECLTLLKPYSVQ